MSNVVGRVFRRRPGTWVYEVEADGVVVCSDNTGSWSVILEACREHRTAVETIYRSGHKLRPWADILEEADPL